MVIAKGMFINFNAVQSSTSVVRLCFVEKGGANASLVFFSDESKGLRQFSRVNLNSQKVLDRISIVKNPHSIAHAELIAFEKRTNAKCKKGSYVSILNNDKVRVYGIITKGGSKPTASIVNSRIEITSSAANFKDEGNPPVIEVPVELKYWSISNYKYHESLSEDSIAFSASVKYKGKTVLNVKNGGYGGCMQTDGSNKHAQLLNKNIVESVVRLFPDENYRPDTSELDEVFVNWLYHGKPCLVEWEEELKEYIFNL